MKNISSELEFGGKQSLETLENHQNGLLPFPGMGRPDLSAINGIGSLAKSKERLSSQSSAHFSSSETLNSCEQPLLPASPSYLSSSSPRDRRQPSDRCVWRGLRVGRSLRKCQNPCMSEWRNGGEASGMVRSASLLEIRHSPKFSHADVEFGPEPCPGQCGDDRWPESNANDSSTEASKACCHCATRRASSPTTAPRSDSANGPLSLSAVLESIPIAYNPRTKQLHIISVSPNQARQPNCGHESDGPDADRGHEDKLNEEVRKVSDPVGPKADPGLEHPRTGSLQRVSTCGSSISSISSLSTEFSASTASAFDEGAPIFDVDEAGFIEINLDRQSNRSERSLATHEGPLSEDECEATQGAKPKKRGLSGFLSRNLLPWKSSKEVSISDSAAAGWKLFGKAAPRHSNITDPNKVIEEYHARQRNQANPSTDGSTAPRSRKSEELIASSTTALILENRPS